MSNTIYSYEFIAPQECLGDSLVKIRNNDFNAHYATGVLETRIVAVSSQLIQANTFVNTTTPYTVVAADGGKTILQDFSSANTLNLPAGLSVGFQINVIQIGTGQTTFAATGGTTLRHPDGFTKIYKRWSSASAVFVGSNNWVLVGDLIS